MIGALLCAAALAAGPGQPGGPEVGQFITPREVASAFAVSSLGVRQGVGLLSVPDQQWPGYTEPYDLVLVGAVETFEVAARLSPRVGLFAEVEGQVTSGVNPDTAYFQGARSGLRWEGGMVLPMWHDDRTALALRGRFLGTHGVLLEPSRLVDAVLDNPDLTVPDLLDGDLVDYMLTSERTLAGGPTVALASLARPWLRVQASLSATWGRTRAVTWSSGDQLVERASRAGLAAGCAAEVRGGPRVPLAVQPELRVRLEGEDPDVTDVRGSASGRAFGGLGLYYVGRTELQLGLSAATLLRVTGSGQERFVAGEAVLRYLFL